MSHAHSHAEALEAYYAGLIDNPDAPAPEWLDPFVEES